jgi:hypothetical protein
MDRFKGQRVGSQAHTRILLSDARMINDGMAGVIGDVTGY